MSGIGDKVTPKPMSAAPPPLGPIAGVLGTLPKIQAIIESLDRSALADLEASFEWYGVCGGTILFQEGDAAHDAFVLVAGRLGVYLEAELGARLTAQIGPGELVGEMALISGEPRSATVVALRDSEVVRIPRQAVERLMGTSPQLMLYVVRLLVDRLRRSQRPSLPQATKTLAFIPVDDEPLEQDFADRIQKGFSTLSVRVGLIGSVNSQLSAEAIAAIEEQHDLVLYLGDRRCSAWSSRCLRQADHVVFVADADYKPDADTDTQISDVRRLHRAADLMLLNKADAIEPDGATRWLGRLSPDRIFHARGGNSADYARVARLTTGRAVGLVLSGGGARGFAHVGAIRALEAAGIPIDLVGGTSMGAVVGCGVAAGRSTQEIAARLRSGFVETNPVNDYTLPLFSLVRGRKMARLLREHCGDRVIENLWKNFFCISSNLSTGKVSLHQQGLVWRALRASTAIPGVVPPFIDQGQVLVDGGIMNNFPADIMSSQARGMVVGVDVVAGTRFFAETSDIEEKSLLWRLRNRSGSAPGIGRVLVRSATVGSEAQTVLSRSKVERPDPAAARRHRHAVVQIVRCGGRARLSGHVGSDRANRGSLGLIRRRSRWCLCTVILTGWIAASSLPKEQCYRMWQAANMLLNRSS